MLPATVSASAVEVIDEVEESKDHIGSSSLLHNFPSPWKWGRRAKRQQYQEIIDDEEEYWTHLFKPHNIGIPLSYALVGFIPSFVSTPLAVYLVRTLDAHPIVQNQISICVSIPWAFKICFGFLSDACPLWGERRRPYIYLGSILSSLVYCYLGFVGTPTAPVLGLCLCLCTFGMVMTDTMSDAMVVERSRKEVEDDHGHLQSACYAYRFGGAIMGAILGGILYNKAEWGFGLTFSQIMYISGLLPLLVLLPFLPFLREMPPHHSLGTDVGEGDASYPSISAQLNQIWRVIELPIVYMPMLFVYLYNLFQVPNVSWTSFLQLRLDFDAYQLGALSFASRVMTFVGILLYKAFFLRSSWRYLYVWTTLLTALFSVLQLLLIFQINTRYLHISNFLFALGDDVMSAFIIGIQFLPLCVQYLKLCPGGSEGSTYALLTTFGNVALIAGNSIGSLFSKIWDVSNSAMRRGDLDGLWKLTVLTSCLSPIPLVLLSLLPSDTEEEKAMRDRAKASPMAGALFLITLTCSLAWIILQAIWVLLANESG